MVREGCKGSLGMGACFPKSWPDRIFGRIIRACRAKQSLIRTIHYGLAAAPVATVGWPAQLVLFSRMGTGAHAHGVLPIRLWYQPDRNWRFMSGARCQRADFSQRMAGFCATGSGAPRGVCPGRYAQGLDRSAWWFLPLPVAVSLPVLVGGRGFRVTKRDIRPHDLDQIPSGRAHHGLHVKATGPAFPTGQRVQRGRVFRRRRHYNFS